MFLRYNKDLGKEPNQVPAKGLGKSLCYWPRNNAPFCLPIRSKREVNCGLLSLHFPAPGAGYFFRDLIGSFHFPRAYVCIIYEKREGNSLENIAWSELGKQTYKLKRSITSISFDQLLTLPVKSPSVNLT